MNRLLPLAIAYLIASIAYFIAAWPALSQATRPNCASRDLILTQGKKAFNEEPSAIGTLRNGALVELLLSDKGSWTIMITFMGKSCILVSGDDWEEHTKPGRDS